MLESPWRRYAERLRRVLPVGRPEYRQQLIRGPDVELALFAFAVGVERLGQIGEERRGADVAAGVGGDPDRFVGRDDPPIERGGRRRIGFPTEQHGDEGVDEQGAAGECVGTGLQVEGVDPHAGRAEVDVGAAGRGGGHG